MEEEEDSELNKKFTARPLNKQILEKQSMLPAVEKKKTTEFEEFNLSQTNDLTKRTRKILEEYQ